eukprot:Rhum_TRINITY_DN14095_c10_g1::Rhum_TRINITY_DN14095_c10_g1_i3::g.68919::m.68919
MEDRRPLHASPAAALEVRRHRPREEAAVGDQVRHKAPTVHGGRRVDAGQAEHRRCDVHLRRKRVDGGVAGDARSREEHGDAEAVLVEEELVARQHVVPQVVPVVARHQHVRLLRHPRVLQRLQDPVVRVVHRQQRLAPVRRQVVDRPRVLRVEVRLARHQVVELALPRQRRRRQQRALPPAVHRPAVVPVREPRRDPRVAVRVVRVPRRRRRRRVRRVRRKVHEERPPLARHLVDPLHRHVPQRRRRVPVPPPRPRLAPRLRRRRAPVRRRPRPRAVRRPVVEERPVVVRRPLEPPVERPHQVQVQLRPAVEPPLRVHPAPVVHALPEQPVHVPPLPPQRRREHVRPHPPQVHLVRRPAAHRRRRRLLRRHDVVEVPPRLQLRARRRADRRVDAELRGGDALSLDLLLRCGHAVPAADDQVLVVGEHQHDVRAVRAGRARRGGTGRLHATGHGQQRGGNRQRLHFVKKRDVFFSSAETRNEVQIL